MKLRIKELRHQRGLSLAQLGEKVERKAHTIYYYENGTINISLGMLAEIATALDCTVLDLLGEQGIPCLAPVSTPEDIPA